MKLYTALEISKNLGVSFKTVIEKANRLGLTPYKKQGLKTFFFDAEQFYKIKTMQIENYRVEIIHHSEIFYIIESSINKKTPIYGTHRFRKKMLKFDYVK